MLCILKLSCSKHDSGEIEDLIPPVRLVAGKEIKIVISDLFYLEDYDVSFKSNPNVKINYDQSQNSIDIKSEKNFEGLTLVEFEVNNEIYDLLVISKTEKYYKFSYKPDEDFAQLAGKSRDTKYDSSLERVVGIVDENCTFPALEKIKLFQRILFNFVIGNEDMHLKNYSLITVDETVKLAPAYDFVNTTIALSNPQEESALPVNGKKNNIQNSDLVKYLAVERMRLNKKQISSIVENLKKSIPTWKELISISFLSDEMKSNYQALLYDRLERLGMINN